MLKIFKCIAITFCLITVSCSPLPPKEIASTATTPVKKEKTTLYHTVIFDVASVGTGTPSRNALRFFVKKIRNYRIAKNIIIRQRSNISSPYELWNLGLVSQFESEHRQLYDKNDKDKILVVFVCYLPGICIYGSSTNIAGVQYDTHSFAIFRTITDNEWEGVVLLHELGHLLGIARARNRIQRPINPDRPNHCNDTNCTMFWRAGTHRTSLCRLCTTELEKLIKGEPLNRARLY